MNPALFGLLLWSTVAGAIPTAVPAAEAQTQAQAPIVVPFAPPIGRPLRYRLDRTLIRSGRTVRVWSVHQLIFERRTGGYTMRVSLLETGLHDAPEPEQRLYQRVARELDLPYALLISADGVVEGLENEEAYWATMLRIVEARLRAAQPQEQGAGPDLVAETMAMMRDTSREGRLNLVAQFLGPILEFADTSFALGERRTASVPTEGIMGLSLNQDVTIVPDGVRDGHLTIRVLSSVPPGELARAVEQFLARIPVTGLGQNTEAGRARGLAELRAGRIVREGEATYEISLDTGLARRVRLSDRVESTIGGRTTVRTTGFELERVD